MMLCHFWESTPDLSPCRESLVWGNQEPLWPVSRAAMKAVASGRVEMLAKSKANSQEAFPDKCSRYFKEEYYLFKLKIIAYSS